uniref:Uncharacterized protein n=2 Tax=Pseudomonas syringae TaxID=317 RepID=I3W2G0_PSESX|nr:hypothetical protein [Pseudomonas syringae]
MANPPDIPPQQVAELLPGEDLARLRLYAERYEWLRQRAVKIQGSDIWYSGNYLDLRVDIGLGHRNEDE